MIFKKETRIKSYIDIYSIFETLNIKYRAIFRTIKCMSKTDTRIENVGSKFIRKNRGERSRFIK